MWANCGPSLFSDRVAATATSETARAGTRIRAIRRVIGGPPGGRRYRRAIMAAGRAGRQALRVAAGGRLDFPGPPFYARGAMKTKAEIVKDWLPRYTGRPL